MFLGILGIYDSRSWYSAMSNMLAFVSQFSACGTCWCVRLMNHLANTSLNPRMTEISAIVRNAELTIATIRQYLILCEWWLTGYHSNRWAPLVLYLYFPIILKKLLYRRRFISVDETRSMYLWVETLKLGLPKIVSKFDVNVMTSDISGGWLFSNKLLLISDIWLNHCRWSVFPA